MEHKIGNPKGLEYILKGFDGGIIRDINEINYRKLPRKISKEERFFLKKIIYLKSLGWNNIKKE